MRSEKTVTVETGHASLPTRRSLWSDLVVSSCASFSSLAFPRLSLTWTQKQVGGVQL